MDKVDLKKDLKHLYNPSAKDVSVVDVPAMNFLMVDGEGSPDAPQYGEAIQALFSVSYALRFMIKKGKGIDYAVMPLEGLWWADDMAHFAENKDKWKWTAMIMQPKYVTAAEVALAVEQTAKKKKLPALSKLKFESFQEGKAVQIMHIGPFSAEGPNIQRMHQYITDSGHTLSGKHHEIYLGDPSKTAPEKLKTVLRQPMK